MYESKLKGILELGKGHELKLDKIDGKLLAVLGMNARATHVVLAKALNLSKASITYRLNRLKDFDLLRGTTIITNPYNLGFTWYTVFLRFENIDDDKELAIIEKIAGHPLVVWLGVCLGWDLGIHLLAKDEAHMQAMMKQIEEICSSCLSEVMLLPCTMMFGFWNLPPQMMKALKVDFSKKDTSFQAFFHGRRASKSEAVKLDEVDALVLKELAAEARTPMAAIAAKAGVTTDTVRARIERLIKNKVILAFNPVLNVSFMNLQIYVVLLKVRPNADTTQFEAFLEMELPFSFRTFGVWDYMLWLGVKSDLEFFYFVRALRKQFHSIILSYGTLSVIKDFKFNFFPDGLLNESNKQ